MDNFSIPSRSWLEMPKEQYSEIVCLNCNKQFYLLKVLGTDNVYRQLPGHCRDCDVAGPIQEHG